MRNGVKFFKFKTTLLLGLTLLGLIMLAGGCSPSQSTVQIKIAVVGDDIEEWRPVLMSVRTGGTVSWLNNGNEGHSVISDESLWSDRHLPPGESFNFTFTTPGTFTYRDVTDTFTGTILVK